MGARVWSSFSRSYITYPDTRTWQEMAELIPNYLVRPPNASDKSRTPFVSGRRLGSAVLPLLHLALCCKRGQWSCRIVLHRILPCLKGYAPTYFCPVFVCLLFFRSKGESHHCMYLDANMGNVTGLFWIPSYVSKVPTTEFLSRLFFSLWKGEPHHCMYLDTDMGNVKEFFWIRSYVSKVFAIFKKIIFFPFSLERWYLINVCTLMQTWAMSQNCSEYPLMSHREILNIYCTVVAFFVAFFFFYWKVESPSLYWNDAKNGHWSCRIAMNIHWYIFVLFFS